MPETSKEKEKEKEKVRREVKMDKCPTVELGVQDSPQKPQVQGRYVPPQKSKVELDFHHYFCHYHHSFATHAHLDLTY